MIFIRFLPVLLTVGLLRAGAATLTVSNTSDSGPGSLREAITTANQTAEADVIVFGLPVSGSQMIELFTALPPLSGTLSILNGQIPPIVIQRSTASATPRFRIFEVGPSATVTMSGLAISNGAADSWGAGIMNNSSQLVLRRCSVTGNSTSGRGGGIATLGAATLDATDCTFSNNSAYGGGGVYTAVSGRTSLTNCTLTNNTATNGGGLMNDSAGFAAKPELRIKNCTFSGNSAQESGGAIYDFVRDPDRVSIVSSTITGNVAGFKAGGIIAYNGDTGAYLRLGNTIIAGNNCLTYGNVYGYDLSPGQYVTDGHNILGRQPDNVVLPGMTTTGLVNGVKGDQVGTTQKPIDPKLGPLQMNGGSTPTHALLPASPAIDNGDDALAPARDQRGYARLDTADVGAFEFGGTYALSVLNISTRGKVDSGSNVLIVGFIIVGNQPKRVIIRAIGPSLSISDRLANPRLDLWNSAGQMLASNDDWTQASNHQEISDSSLAPADNLESAILTTLTPGVYTAVVNGVDDTSGIGVVEVYDLGTDAEARLANISTRGVVGVDDNVMIGGFIVVGPRTQNILIRALGPSLPFSTDLPDPFLELHDQNGALLRANDDWRTDQKQEIEATGIPPTSDHESAMVSVFSPGNYTAVVRDAKGSVGIGLVEVYALD